MLPVPAPDGLYRPAPIFFSFMEVSALRSGIYGMSGNPLIHYAPVDTFNDLAHRADALHKLLPYPTVKFYTLAIQPLSLTTSLSYNPADAATPLQTTHFASGRRPIHCSRP